MLPQENESYSALFSQMIRTMVRLETGHQSKLRYKYTALQKDRLDILVKYLHKDVQRKSKESETEAIGAYQAFCWSIVFSPGERSQKRWGNPIQRFIWLMALQEEGSFMQASDLTPLLAKLKYFCRLVTLHEALVGCDPGEDDLG